jgi:hypothetical protein
MWINVGMSQVHLPTRSPNVLRGRIGLVIPDRPALLNRLNQARKLLDGTQFDFKESNDGVEAICPWGNRFAIHAPDPGRFGNVALGMPYIEFDVRPGTAAGIARFYREVMGAPAELVENGGAVRARVQVGARQYFYFCETDAPERPYDGHHIQVYIAAFSATHARLAERKLLTAESSQWEYRFRDIVDLDSGAVLFTVEHELRSQTHPMFGRPLINRNPAQGVRDYRPGTDALAWTLPPDRSGDPIDD